jgi:hypothetical protein
MKYSKEVTSHSSTLNCTTYDLTMSAGDKKNSDAGIGLPNNVNNNNSDENLTVESVMVETEKLGKLH